MSPLISLALALAKCAHIRVDEMFMSPGSNRSFLLTVWQETFEGEKFLTIDRK